MPPVVIGLGNPGEEYSRNRHNIGFHVVDRIAGECGCVVRRPHFLSRYETAKCSWQGRPLVLVKPLTYMNASGEIVKAVLRQAKAAPADLLIVCDSLDLDLGVLKMKLQGSSGGHRGLASILAALKTDAVPRLSIGIGRPARGRSAVVGHVLGDPSPEDAALLDRAVETAVAHILRLCKEPKERVMGDVNRRERRDAREKD